MTSGYCSTCGGQLAPGAAFCSTCGAAVGPAQLTERQALARSAMNVQTMNIVIWIGAIVGAVIGFALPGMLLFEPMRDDAGFLWFILCLGGGLLGFFVGSRAALMLMAR